MSQPHTYTVEYTPKSRRSHSLSTTLASTSLGLPKVGGTRASAPKLSCEEIINRMENEQDAIVVRLLREINALRSENSRLRNQLAHSHTPSHNQNHNHPTAAATPRNRSRSNTLRSPVAVAVDEEAITDDEDGDMHLKVASTPSLTAAPMTPRSSFNSTPVHSRRPSSSSYSSTIFPVETGASFVRPQRFSFSYTVAPSAAPAVFPLPESSSSATAANSTVAPPSRKRRTSSSLEHSSHFKNHERKVSEILPQR